MCKNDCCNGDTQPRQDGLSFSYYPQAGVVKAKLFGVFVVFCLVFLRCFVWCFCLVFLWCFVWCFCGVLFGVFALFCLVFLWCFVWCFCDAPKICHIFQHHRNSHGIRTIKAGRQTGKCKIFQSIYQPFCQSLLSVICSPTELLPLKAP